MLRLFLAIPIPDQTLDLLEKWQDELLSEEMRKMKKQGLHITQLFIGNVDESLLNKIDSVFSETLITLPSFVLKSEKIMVFPEKSPNMVWLKFREDTIFTEVQEILQHKFDKENIPCERRKTEPHITLARFKKNQDHSISSQAMNIDIPVHHYELWKSDLTQHGSNYSTLKTYKLL